MNYTTNERAMYNTRRDHVCGALEITKNQYNKFRRIGEALNRLYTAECNGEIESVEAERMADVWYEKASIEASLLGLAIFYQTDPRGASIYLSKEPIEPNNYNRPGSNCIY